jgi:hypothetical protein
MAMIEDMDAAVLWLSTVSVRFVNSIQQTKVDSKNDSDASVQPEKRERTKKRYHAITHQIL